MNNDSPIKILFLAADPSDATRLRLGQELRDIREKLQLSKYRERFILESRESIRPGDISQAIFDVEPNIVHFSGHGRNQGELCFENVLGMVQPVRPDALASLFELVADQVECVVLNACYSENQAKGISGHIKFVIGMSKAIGDRAAIAFAIGFYRALGANYSIEKAYKFGCAEIGLEDIPEQLTPVLHLKRRQDTQIRWMLVLKASINDLDKQQLDSVVENLRHISGDASLTLEKLESSSTKSTFVIVSLQEGFEQLEFLFRTGQLLEILGIAVQNLQFVDFTQWEAPILQPQGFAQELAENWRSRLAMDLPNHDSTLCESIICWLLGEDLSRFDNLSPELRKVAEQAIDYRYNTLRQHYLSVMPGSGYRRLIQRLSSISVIKNKIYEWLSLSKNSQRTITDVLEEVIQEILTNDTYMQRQIPWISRCTSSSRLRNALLLATTEEYCLRPIRSQPLLVYRFVNYQRSSQKERVNQILSGDLSDLVLEEFSSEDSTAISLLDTQSVIQYQDTKAIEEQRELRNAIKRAFEAYLIEKVGPIAGQWLSLYLEGKSQEAIAQTLNMSMKQVYRLREKINYHAVRFFATKSQQELVRSWLGHNL